MQVNIQNLSVCARVREILAALTIMLSFSASAAEHFQGPMRFSAYWPCEGNASFCGVRILAEGVVQADSGRRLALFLANPKQHAHPLPPVPTIVFDSPGGNLAGGMALGREIRKARLDTELDITYTRVADDGSDRDESLVAAPRCASACAIAFAGGVERTVQPGSRLGIHQFSASVGSIGDSASQVAGVVLAAYLEEMGVDRALLDAASLVPATSIKWVSDTEARQFFIDNTRPLLSSWKVVALPQGDAVLDLEQQLQGGRRVNLRIAVRGSQTYLLATTTLDKAFIGQDRIRQFPVGEQPQLMFCAGAQCLTGSPVSPWSRSETKTAVVMQAMAVFPTQKLQEVSRAASLSVSDNFGRVFADVSLQTNVSSGGLANGISLLSRIK